MIKYSIIIPVYNAEDSIDKCINSIINQTYENWELLLIDDGSTDNSTNIIDKYKNQDSRIKVYHQKNEGPGKARNFGLKNCNGNYVSFVDSDDYIEEDYLETINKKVIENEFDLIFITMINEKNNGNIINYVNTNNYSNYTQNELLNLEIMGIVPWGPCSKVAKRDIVNECTFSDLPVGEEIIYSFKVISKARKIGFVDKPLYHYVHNENGQHKKGGIDPWYLVVSNMKEHLEKSGRLEQHKKALNGLAFKALSISIYRISTEFKYKESLKRIKQQVKKYQTEYNFKEINKKFLDKTSRIILLFINIKLYFPLYFASKLKQKTK